MSNSKAYHGPWDKRDPSDFRIEWFSGTGNGGQHRNKVQNCCRLIHLPSGTIQTAQSRSREKSLSTAMELMVERLDDNLRRATGIMINEDRQRMTGSGDRSNKRRTYRFQDDRVTDHVTGKTAKCTSVMKGGFSALWE